MIYNLKGRLTVCDANFIVVECGGIGFKCFTSLNTAKQLAEIGKEVNVYTHLAVREDAMDLYAFATVAELDAFKLLITVSGIGPKAGISILSELTPDRLALCIASGDAKSITKAQGIGKKTAERVVLERIKSVQLQPMRYRVLYQMFKILIKARQAKRLKHLFRSAIHNPMQPLL